VGARLYQVQLDATFTPPGSAGAMQDVLAVYLVDPIHPSQTLLDRGLPGTAIFTLSGTKAEYAPGIASWDGSVLQIDTTQLTSSDTAILRFQLLNSDGAVGSQVSIKPLSHVVDTRIAERSSFSLLEDIPAAAGSTLNLSNLTVASNVDWEFSDIRFDKSTGKYQAEVRVLNHGAPLGRNVALVLPGLPAGVTVDNPSGVTDSNEPYLNLRPAIESGGLDAGVRSAAVTLAINDPSQALFVLHPRILADSNHAPLLDSLPPLQVMPGGVLSAPLSASDADGDQVTISIDGMERLPTATFNADNTLVFRPTPDQIGAYSFDVVASDGVSQTRKNVRLDVVADPVTTTRVSGRILNVDGSPIANMQVEIGAVQTLTAVDGSFLLDLGLGPAVSDTLRVRGELFVSSSSYPFIGEKLALLLEHEPFVGVNNRIDRPIYLPTLDTAGGRTIDPLHDTTVTASAIPGASVVVRAGTLMNQQGSPFTGMLTMTEVPRDLTPAALPDDLHPDLVVTIQPGEMVFASPAPLTLPNRSGYAAGTLFTLWSINPVTGQFDNVGIGQVSLDGSTISTISGGIRNSSWHLFSPIVSSPTDPNQDPFNELNDCNSCKSLLSVAIDNVNVGSDIEEHSGAVLEDYQLPTYHSLGLDRGVTLHYDSNRADPRPIIHFGEDEVQTNANVRFVASLAVHVHNVDVSVGGATAGELGLAGGENVWSIPDFPPNSQYQNRQVGNLEAALQVDLRTAPTGAYSYTLDTGLRQLSSAGLSGTDVSQEGVIVHINSVNSPFGSGWGLAGLEQIFVNDNKSLLLVDGDGSELVFQPPQSAGQPYISPPGDFSTLERLADGSFRRTFTDQTVHQFNSQNVLASVSDRNGNSIQYAYAGGLLTSITDPVGLVTSLVYAGGKLSTITDPAGRATAFAYDAAGNLIRATAPDSTRREWRYDSNHHLTVATDPLGHSALHDYDQFGRAVGVTRADGSVLRITPAQTQTLLPPSATANPTSPPPAFIRPSALAYSMDGVGNVQVTQLDQYGQEVATRDLVGVRGTVTRNEDNQVTQWTDGRGQTTSYAYDDRGNLQATNVVTLSGNEESTSYFAARQFTVSEAAALGVTSTRHSTVADVNEDGRLDFICQFQDEDSLSIAVFFGDGADGFGGPQIVDLGLTYDRNFLVDIKAEDLNGDGHLDLTVATPLSESGEFHGEIVIVLGNGDGTFSAPQRFYGGQKPSQIVIGDINSDGHLDIVTANNVFDAPLSSLLGDGAGGFTVAPAVVRGGDPWPQAMFGLQMIAAADFNRDGNLDLVGRGFGLGILVLVGDGTGAFTEIGEYPPSPFAESAARWVDVADVDADGNVDVVIASQNFPVITNFNVSVLFGDGTGVFMPQQITTIFGDPSAMRIVDLNHDELPEIITASVISDSFVQAYSYQVLINESTRQFTLMPSVSAELLPITMELADFNLDGELDLITTSYTEAQLQIRLGNGQGGFVEPTSKSWNGKQLLDTASGDVNGDGQLDLVVTRVGGSTITLAVDTFAGFGYNPQFSTTNRMIQLGQRAESIRLVDVDGDAKLDIVTANRLDGTVSVLKGDGHGEFGVPVNYVVGAEPVSLVVADLNGDSYLDIATADNAANTITFLLGLGNGSFAGAGTIPWEHGRLHEFGRYLAAPDMNGDGRVDLVTSNGEAQSLSVFLNLGFGVFSSPLTHALPNYTGPLAAGELNGDLRVDFAVTSDVAAKVTLLFGDGAGQFASTREFSTSFPPGVIEIAELNSDSVPDLLAGSSQSLAVALLASDGNGNWIQTDAAVGMSTQSIVLNDFSEDGVVDVFIASQGNQIGSVNGIGVVERWPYGELRLVPPQVVWRLYDEAGSPNRKSLADINADGRLDLVFTSLVTELPKTVVMLADDRGGFGEPIVSDSTFMRPADYSSPKWTTGDLNNDGHLDLIGVFMSDAYGSHPYVGVQSGDGQGHFSAPRELAQLNNPNTESLAVGDWNNDGFLDVVAANTQTTIGDPLVPTLSILLGSAEGNLSLSQDVTLLLTGSAFLRPNHVAMEDVSGDGNVDIVVAGYAGFSTNSIMIFLGKGDGQFLGTRNVPIATNFNQGNYPQFLSLSDVNLDGRIDILTANRATENAVSIFMNLGNGDFADQRDVDVGGDAQSLFVADIDLDGLTDIVTGNLDDSVSIALGAGGGGYRPAQLFYAGGLVQGVTDLNGDSMLDMIAVGSDSLSFILASGQRHAITSSATYEASFNQPTSWVDERGSRTVFDVDPANGNRRSATDSAGQVTSYTYTPQGLLATMTDPLGRVTVYTYDAVGRRTSIVTARGTAEEASEHYEYDNAGNVTAYIDANNHRFEYEYDAWNRQTLERNSLGNTTHFTYDAAGNLTRTQDALGHENHNEYDRLNRLEQTTDALNQITQLDYNREGKLVSTTDALGRVTRYRYDSRNRLSGMTDAMGGVTEYRYDANDNVIAVVDPRKNREVMIYDGLNRLARVIDATGAITRNVYDSAGDLIATKDANGNLTRFAYDSLGRLVSETDALGGVTTYEYDAVGNLVSQTDALGRTTAYAYDARDRLVRTTDVLQGFATIGYDSVGNITSRTDALGFTTHYAYDAADQPTSLTDPLGNATHMVYDANGNLLSSTDPHGHSIQFAYDALDRVVRRTDALGHSQLFAYDAANNLVRGTDELGHKTDYSYDLLDRLVSVTDPLGHVSRTAYDANSNIVSTTDGLGRTTRYTYDAVGRRTAVTDARGSVTTYQYDPAGRLVTLTDPALNATHYAYDALNRRTSETNSLGFSRTYTYDAVGKPTAMTDRDGRTRRFVYDSLDRQTDEQWLDGGGLVTRTIHRVFNAASQLVSVTDPDSTLSYGYDADGRMTSVSNLGTPGIPTVAFGYTYDVVGNLTRRSDTVDAQAAGQIDYQYDARNQPTRIGQTGSGVADKRVDFRYTAAGLMNAVDRYADLAGSQLVATSTYTFDEANRLTALAHARSTTTIAQYTWILDAADRITRATTPDGTSNYTYDAVDELTGADHSTQTDESYVYDANGNRDNVGYDVGESNRLNSDGVYNYTYDFEGNRVSRTNIATNERTEYQWDYRNRLTGVVTKNAAGAIIKESHYTYDALDRRITKSVDSDGAGPNAPDVTNFAYDGANIALAFNSTGQITHRYLYGASIDQVLADERPGAELLWDLTDNLGSVRDLITSAGVVRDHIVYDSFGRVISETNATVDHLFGFTGRERDRETGLMNYRARYYDPSVGAFLGVDPLFAASDEPYSANGYAYARNSPTLFTDPSGLDPRLGPTNESPLFSPAEWLAKARSGENSPIQVFKALRDAFALEMISLEVAQQNLANGSRPFYSISSLNQSMNSLWRAMKIQWAILKKLPPEARGVTPIRPSACPPGMNNAQTQPIPRGAANAKADTQAIPRGGARANMTQPNRVAPVNANPTLAVGASETNAAKSRINTRNAKYQPSFGVSAINRASLLRTFLQHGPTMVAAGLSVYGTIATVYSVGDVTTQVVNAAPQDRLQVAGSGYGGVAGSVGGGVAGLSAGAFLFPALFTGPIGALGAGFVFPRRRRYTVVAVTAWTAESARVRRGRRRPAADGTDAWCRNAASRPSGRSSPAVVRMRTTR
jgi:RHS repeat-associated protein